jgi:hypothetical protein
VSANVFPPTLQLHLARISLGVFMASRLNDPEHVRAAWMKLALYKLLVLGEEIDHVNP